MRELNKVCTEKLRAATGDPNIKPLYIFDNVALQAYASYQEMGIKWHQHVKTPGHSPDFNKPIEHCWNQIKRKLLNRVYESYDVMLTPALAQQWVVEAWNSITQESVKKDVESLKDTWLIVKTRLGETVTTSKKEKSKALVVTIPLHPCTANWCYSLQVAQPAPGREGVAVWLHSPV